MVTPEKNLIPRLGVLALELDDELKPGDVVYAVNGVSVLGLSELRSAVGRPAPGQPLVLHVERGGRLIYVVIEAE